MGGLPNRQYRFVQLPILYLREQHLFLGFLSSLCVYLAHVAQKASWPPPERKLDKNTSHHPAIVVYLVCESSGFTIDLLVS